MSKISKEEALKSIYNDPTMLTEIVSANKSQTYKHVRVELACFDFDIDPETEYKIVTQDRSFKIEFDRYGDMDFYLQSSIGFQLYKRPVSKEFPNPNLWKMELDLSHIN